MSFQGNEYYLYIKKEKGKILVTMDFLFSFLVLNNDNKMKLITQGNGIQLEPRYKKLDSKNLKAKQQEQR